MPVVRLSLEACRGGLLCRRWLRSLAARVGAGATWPESVDAADVGATCRIEVFSHSTFVTECSIWTGAICGP